MTHRRDLNSLSLAERTALVGLMLNYINDRVVAEHTTITHAFALFESAAQMAVSGCALSNLLDTRTSLQLNAY